MAVCRQVEFATGGFLRTAYTKAGVMRMTNMQLFSLLIAIASLVFAAYVAGTQNRR